MQDANEVESRGFGWGKFFIFILIMISIIGIALYSFFDINPMDMIKSGFNGLYERMRQTVGESNQKIKEIFIYEPSELMSHEVFKDSIVVCSISDVRLFSSDGDEKWYVPVNLKKPFVQAYDKDILVADLGGKYFGLIRDGKIIWEKNPDEEIVNASISDNWILIITKNAETGYKRTIHAYSKEGEEVSYRSLADYYPFSANHFPQYNKTGFVICGVETQGLKTTSLFEFLDLSMNQRGIKRDQEEIFSWVRPFNDGKLLLVGEKSLNCLDQGLNTVWRVDLKQDYLTSADISKEQLTVAAVLDGEILNREKRNLTHIRLINPNGSIKAQRDVDALVTQIVSSGRTIAFAADSEVYFINEKGEVMDLYTSKTHVDQVFLARENLAYIVTGGSIVRVKVDVSDKLLGIF